MSWFSSLLTGQDPNLNKAIGSTGQIAGFATGLGEANLAKASQFNNSILSGDPTQIARVMAPQIKNATGQAAQERKGLAEFGNRSGGTNAASQGITDSTRGSINNMVNGLLGGTVSNMQSVGSNLLSQGQESYKDFAKLSSDRMENWADSIFGMGMTQASGAVMGAATTAGMNAIPGLNAASSATQG